MKTSQIVSVVCLVVAAMSTATAHAAYPPACDTTNYRQSFSDKWTFGGFGFRINDSSIPATLSKTGVKKAVAAGGNTWTRMRNLCGRPDISRFFIEFETFDDTDVRDWEDSYNTVAFLYLQYDPGSQEYYLLQPSRCDGAPIGCSHTTHRDGVAYETDIAYNKATKWHTRVRRDIAADAYDLRSVAAHEFGHSIGIGHNSGKKGSDATDAERNQVMYKFSENGETKRYLGKGDIFALCSISETCY
jgi:hypothetical protein